jgi:hypothetical protein
MSSFDESVDSVYVSRNPRRPSVSSAPIPIPQSQSGSNHDSFDESEGCQIVRGKGAASEAKFFLPRPPIACSLEADKPVSFTERWRPYSVT